MAENQFNQTCAMLRKIDFKHFNVIDNKFLCTICHKLMVNAQGGPCGCTYCLHCIRSYLDGTKKTCPGGMEHCKELILNFDRDIYINHRMNTKIMKLIVKCPDSSCEYRGQLKAIPDHMKMSNHQVSYMKCPFCDMGCNGVNLMKYEMGVHLHSEILSHSTLLIQWVNNLANEMASLRNENICQKEEIKKMKTENDGMHEVKRIEICGLNTKLTNNIVEMNNLKGIIQRDRTTFEREGQQMKRSQGVFGNANNGIFSLTFPTMPKILKSESNCEEFMWHGDEWFSSYMKLKSGVYSTISSKPFLSREGYQMCLMFINSDFGIYIRPCITKGPSDYALRWPFTHDIIIDIINKQTGSIYTTKVWKCDITDKRWEKPKSNQRRHKIREYEDLRFDSNWDKLDIENILLIKCTLHNNRS